MERFDENTKKEIEKSILKWNEKNMSKKEIEDYFEDCCSIWSSIYEIKSYFDEDNEDMSIDELAKQDWIVFLSNGEVLMLG